MEVSAQAKKGLCERLRARRPEIERALLDRVYAIGDLSEAGDSGYVEGFREVVAAAFEFSIETLEASGHSTPLVPPALISQARLAARSRVSLDTVLRRYAAGHAVLVDFLLEEVDHDPAIPPVLLRHLLVGTSSAFDHLLSAVGTAYTQESDQRRLSSRESARTELVKRLLGGERLDLDEHGYDLKGWHVAVIALGSDVSAHLQHMARTHDRRLLTVEPQQYVGWAWLGGRTKIPAAVVAEEVHRSGSRGPTFIFGEAAEGRAGWRLTHEQAKAALPLARRQGEQVALYSDLALLASAVKDDVLVESLRRMYLDPLSSGRNGGEVLRRTLRAYFATDRNISSTAATLSVNRQTVRKRLSTVEEELGRPVSSCAAELELALKLDGSPVPPCRKQPTTGAELAKPA